MTCLRQPRDLQHGGSKGVYFVKSFEDTKILVALNFSSEEQDLEIPPSLKERTMELLVANVN
jgi:hypothetical protein